MLAALAHRRGASAFLGDAGEPAGIDTLDGIRLTF